MKQRPLLAVHVTLTAIMFAVIAYFVLRGEKPAPPVGTERPTIALLTSLPLVFGESFSLDGGGSPTLDRLEQHYKVQLIGVADTASLKGQRLLLMAHPRAQPAEALVDLDRWVRDGGHLLLLADPKLDWPSERPLGDVLRPSPMFADTGLLAHWGISLSGPYPDGLTTRRYGNREILTSAPGRLEAGAGCKADAQGFVVRCSIGKGRATVIADADFLNVEGPGALDGPTTHNLDLLTEELGRLGTR